MCGGGPVEVMTVVCNNCRRLKLVLEVKTSDYKNQLIMVIFKEKYKCPIVHKTGR